MVNTYKDYTFINNKFRNFLNYNSWPYPKPKTLVSSNDVLILMLPLYNATFKAGQI